MGHNNYIFLPITYCKSPPWTFLIYVAYERPPQPSQFSLLLPIRCLPRMRNEASQSNKDDEVSLYVSSIFLFYPFSFRYKRWLLRWCLVTETTVSRAMTLRMTLTFSPFLISYSLQPTTIQCSPWVTYLVKTGHKKAITLACYRKILDKGIMPQCVLTHAARRRQVGYLCIHWAPIQKSAQVF